MVPVTVARRQRRVNKRNQISGHRWVEFIPINMWDVHDQYGISSSHRSEEKANKVARELQEFYDKYPV